MKITLDEAAKKLMAARRILITAHSNPDGDAIGSSLGLCAFLRREGKEALVVIDDKLPKNLSFLPGYGDIKRPADEDFGADLFVVLDTDMSRIGNAGNMAKGAEVLNIDHHISNDCSAQSVYLEKRAAASEMVFEIIEHLGKDFTEDVAVPLYTGIATDTGFFKFSNTRPETLRAAASLLAAGVRPHEVSEAFEMKPVETVRGEIAAFQTMELFADGRIAGLFLSHELTSSIENTEGFIDFVRVIEGVDAAVLIKAVEENVCRVSMRSRGLNVSDVAMSFGGGGHIRAAGCTIKKPLAEAKRDVIGALERALDDKK